MLDIIMPKTRSRDFALSKGESDESSKTNRYREKETKILKNGENNRANVEHYHYVTREITFLHIILLKRACRGESPCTIYILSFFTINLKGIKLEQCVICVYSINHLMEILIRSTERA